MPDQLSALALGNRRAIFNLLFRSAWKSLKRVLENEQQYEAAASMVLHTWNQHIDSHVHLHAVIPGGGPSLKNPGTWKKAVPPPNERASRWWLVDADDLRHEFRRIFLLGLKKLHTDNKLNLNGKSSELKDAASFDAFLKPMEDKSWVTYIQPPPTEASQPTDIVKYLARYLTGGPISDHRIVNYDGQDVTFHARKGTTHGGSDEVEQVTLPAAEFVRRWSMHILPKGYTKTRGFGGWSNHHSQRYTSECRSLLPASCEEPAQDATVLIDSEDAALGGRSCSHCGGQLERLGDVERYSWKKVFEFDSEYRPGWYRPWETSG